MMKRYLIPLMLVAAVALTSCKSEKKQHAEGLTTLKKPEMNFDHSDTVAVNDLVDNYVNCMANHQIAAASAMLYKVDGDEIRPLDEKEQEAFQTFWSRFNIYGAKRKSFIMRSGLNNDITVMVQISESGDLDREIGVTSFHLNPVYREGQWYLTLLDTKAKGVYDIYDEEDQPSNVGVVSQ